MSKLKWAKRACGIFLLWATAAVALPAQIFTTRYNFCSQGGSGCTDGANPFAGLVQATDGNFYGAAYAGGANDFGSVFRITPSGTLETLHSFDYTDGAFPAAGLVQGTDGSLYGTTFVGGATGEGTVFKMTPSGRLTMLHSFDGTDGYRPTTGLVQGTDGNFYGTVTQGGAGGCSGGCGTVFRITPGGALTTLYSFCSRGGICTDGENPVAGLVQGKDGNFYGTTAGGGGDFGNGTVFKITPSGTLTTLYRFAFGSIELGPVAGLVQASDGDFYGTTGTGGTYNRGTVFKITPGGTLTTLHSFCSTGNCSDGATPHAGLVQATDGNFYGTALVGGASSACFNGCGTVFKITFSGTLTTLHSFDSTDGNYPLGGLIQGTNGNFYGTTVYGGTSTTCTNSQPPGCGTVFGLSVGLAQFVLTQPSAGAVGAAVNILGTNLTGATSVTFNGTAATFNVVSHSLITTTVPAGATSGTVQVANSTGTVFSNVPFTVK